MVPISFSTGTMSGGNPINKHLSSGTFFIIKYLQIPSPYIEHDYRGFNWRKRMKRDISSYFVCKYNGGKLGD